MSKDKRKLAIVILTMNRREQVMEALSSCLNCDFPKKTQIIVVDNGSTDGTEDAIKEYVSNLEIEFIYYKFSKNVGCAPGRQKGYELSNAEYVYFLDDDAIIPKEMYKIFFKETLEYLDSNPFVASLTTRIQDIILNYDRPPDYAKKYINKRPVIMMYLGGSHFLRKNAFNNPLYMDIKYGYEELAPSITAYNNGYSNIYFSDAYIIHKPKVNKWKMDSNEGSDITSLNCYLPYAIKSYLYPTYYKPLLFIFFIMRIFKYFKFDIKKYYYCLETSKKMQYKFKKDGIYNKINGRTVLKLIKLFGKTAL